MQLALLVSHLSSATLLLLLLTGLTTTVSAIIKSACIIPTTTITIEVSSFTPLTHTTMFLSPASTTALWQIDPNCLPGVAQCHHFGDRFRYCSATGFWVPNYCSGDWICCAYSARHGAGPMCESREKCEVIGWPAIAVEGWE